MADIHCNDAVVTAIKDGVKTEIITDTDGIEYSTRALHLLPEYGLDKPAVLTVHTLTGITNFLEYYDVSEYTHNPKLIHIIDYNCVEVLTRIIEKKERVVLASAHLHQFTDAAKFSFGNWYDQETMIIALQTLFVPTSEVMRLLKVIVNVKDERIMNLSDDGFSQSVTARAGIASVAEVELPNPIKLQPYRTFLEIDQPDSLFVVRARQGKPLPEFSLHLADAGLWKLQAIQSIKKYFDDQKLGLSIIG